MPDTHEVLNQPPIRGDIDLWATDPVLRCHAAGADISLLAKWGARLGTAGMRDAGRRANDHPPKLRTHDRRGARIDTVEFHPDYHRLLEAGLESGYSSLPWEGASGGHQTHAALVYLMSQVEPGVCCPLTMTYAAIPALSEFPKWQGKLTDRSYDPLAIPVGQKTGATLGMAMTEKQGGSDVRANATRAEADDDAWRLTGHKWFCSAPMSDGFLTLAQGPDGLTCYLVPRWLEDGPNAIRLMRLKDKLGNRANASAEIEYDRALAWQVGEAGRGVNAILTMVHQTRLDTAIAPAGLMRAALSEAHHWVGHRTAFQRRLLDQPLMRTVLADLVLDLEGATALGFAVATAFDNGDTAFARIGVALAKYIANARAPQVIYEAMQCVGGMGYIEETPMPWLYREAPLNGIWEGSGNVICLDILRTLAKDAAAKEALEVRLNSGAGDPAYDWALGAYRAEWRGLPEEADARLFAERTATLLTAATLYHSAPEVASAYTATRLSAGRGLTSGAVKLDPAPLLARLED